MRTEAEQLIEELKDTLRRHDECEQNAVIAAAAGNRRAAEIAIDNVGNLGAKLLAIARLIAVDSGYVEPGKSSPGLSSDTIH